MQTQTAPTSRIYIQPPKVCPSCGQKLKRDGKFLVCTYEECPAQYAGSMSRWLTKLGIKEWGDSIILAVYEAGMAKDPADLYGLDVKAVAALEVSGSRIGRKAEIAMRNLRAQMELPLHLFVGTLGIPLMARSGCKKVVDAGYDTIDKMHSATEADLASISGLGQRKAKSFVDGMAKREDLIARLLAAGVTIKAPASGPLLGINFCMTGFRDPEMQMRIEENGGTVKGSVSKTTKFLICKNPQGTSGKLKNAHKYGTTVLDIEDGWDLLGGRP